MRKFEAIKILQTRLCSATTYTDNLANLHAALRCAVQQSIHRYLLLARLQQHLLLCSKLGQTDDGRKDAQQIHKHYWRWVYAKGRGDGPEGTLLIYDH